MRRDAVLALGSLREVQAVESLLVALKDADVEVGVAAAVALGQIGDVRAVDQRATRQTAGAPISD